MVALLTSDFVAEGIRARTDMISAAHAAFWKYHLVDSALRIFVINERHQATY